MLVKVTLATRKPHWAALLYVAALFTNSLIFDLAFGSNINAVALKLLISGGVSYGFFWALNEFESSAIYWVVLILGIPAMLYLA